jgi:homoserine dehydrogenase
MKLLNIFNMINVVVLLAKCPGAGAQVTAGDVFADIERIARTLV